MLIFLVISHLGTTALVELPWCCRRGKEKKGENPPFNSDASDSFTLNNKFKLSS